MGLQGKYARAVVTVVALAAASAAQAAPPLGTITEFPTPSRGSGPVGVSAGLDGNVWFTEFAASKIGRVSPLTGAITEYAATGGPARITLGPDGALWYTALSSAKIGRITTRGVITTYPIGRPGSQPLDIVAGADGNLWFTESRGNRIGRITTTGVVTEYLLPIPGSEPTGIAAGPDGNLWVTERSRAPLKARIARLTPRGKLTEFPLVRGGAGPYGITVGPDAHLWFTEYGDNAVGRISTSGVLSLPITLPTPASNPARIVTGPDGALWFTESDERANAIGRLVFGLGIAATPVPKAAAFPTGIGVGSDGQIWFAEENGARVGRVSIGTDVRGPGTRVAGSSRALGTLTCTKASWALAPGALSRRWLRDGLVIAGARGRTYRTGPLDVGHQVTCIDLATYHGASVVPSLAAAGIRIGRGRRLAAAFADTVVLAKQGARVPIRIGSTVPGTARITIRFRNRVVATITRRVRAGDNTLVWNGHVGRAKARRGVYVVTLRVTAPRQRAVTMRIRLRIS
jgi:streptogramin lyase